MQQGTENAARISRKLAVANERNASLQQELEHLRRQEAEFTHAAAQLELVKQRLDETLDTANAQIDSEVERYSQSPHSLAANLLA